MSFTMLLNLTVYQSIFAKALTLKQRVTDSGEITEGERERGIGNNGQLLARCPNS